MFLELRQVSFFYPRGNSPAVDGINLYFDKDGITAVVGPNGSGKTTLTKLMMGIIQPTNGEVCLESRPYANIRWQKSDVVSVTFSRIPVNSFLVPRWRKK